MKFSLRTALLGSVTTSALFAFASPAAAQSCTISPVASPTGTVTCDAGATTNTTNAGTSPAADREYLVTTAGGDASATVDGALTGYGLAITNSVGGANTLTVANNGGVQVDAGNTPSVGGTSALNISGTGATDVVYTGTGSVTSLNPTLGALEIDHNGTGNVTATVGGDLSGYFGADVRSAGSAGDVSLTTDAGTTVVADYYGVLASVDGATSAGTLTLTNNADIGSLTAPNTIQYGVYGNSNGTGDISVTNTGALGSATDAIQTEGITAYKFGTTGDVMVDNSGDVYSAGTGILAVNLGDGATTVTNGAGLIEAAGPAISVSGTTGPLTVTTGDGSVTSTADVAIMTSNGTGDTTITTGSGDVMGDISGIQAVSTGIQSITANGVVTGSTVAGIHSDSTDDRTITVGADGEVTGGAEAILLTNTGTATTNNAGIIGDDSAMVALNATAAGATMLNNASTGTINGTVQFGAGDDMFANAGTFNTAGTSDFGAGDDTFTNTGTINLDGDATFANLETLNLGGTTNTNGYTLTGSGAFNNTGTLNSDGGTFTGFTSYSNSGDLYLTGTTTVDPVPFNNTGTVYSLEGDATLTGQTVFNNNGTIDMVDDAADDSLTIDSAYVGGAGAHLAVDVDDTVADMLIVTGAISGTTAVDANLIGTGAIIDNDVQVVDGQSTSTANAFVLGSVSGNASPLVDYSVNQVGSDYFLSSSLTASAFDPMVISSLVPQLWYPSADEIFANLAVPYKGEGVGFWGQGYYGRDKYGDRDDTFTVAGVDYTVDDRVKHSRFGLQAGVDFGMGDTGRVGVTAGYGWHKLRGAADMDANGWNIGAYGAFGGPTGFHGEALIKHDRYKPDFNNGAFDGYRTKIRSTGVDGAVGYRIPMGGENASFDLSAGVSHVWNKVDDIDAYGIRYSFDNFDSTRGRASARYNFGGEVQPYVSGTVYHEFADGGSVALFDGADTYTIDSRRRGTWGRIEGGIGGAPNRFPTLAAWVDLGDVKGLGARVGMRFGGTSEAAPPPPPPPPPPAPVETPPATQTCYDGSTILATDTCPVPPPPPPPAPAPERG